MRFCEKFYLILSLTFRLSRTEQILDSFSISQIVETAYKGSFKASINEESVEALLFKVHRTAKACAMVLKTRPIAAVFFIDWGFMNRNY